MPIQGLYGCSRYLDAHPSPHQMPRSFFATAGMPRLAMPRCATHAEPGPRWH